MTEASGPVTLGAGDPSYARAVRGFVAEEQAHAALLGRLLERLGVAPLAGHWSDTAFVRLRRALGLRAVAARIVLDERRTWRSTAIGSRGPWHAPPGRPWPPGRPRSG